MTEEDFGMFFDIGDDGYASILEDRVETLQKKLNIATSALQYYAEGTLGSSVAEQALKEIDLVGTLMSLAKEEE